MGVSGCRLDARHLPVPLLPPAADPAHRRLSLPTSPVYWPFLSIGLLGEVHPIEERIFAPKDYLTSAGCKLDGVQGTLRHLLVQD